MRERHRLMALCIALPIEDACVRATSGNTPLVAPVLCPKPQLHTSTRMRQPLVRARHSRRARRRAVARLVFQAQP